MIEEVIKAIIEDLGATGVLILGLCYILRSPIRKIANCIETMNHNSGKTAIILDEINDNLENIGQLLKENISNTEEAKKIEKCQN